MNKILLNKFWWLFALASFALLAFASSLFHAKIDFTKEKRYSLSPSTKQLLNHLHDEVEVQVFLTGNLSSGFKKLSIATEELLENYREYANGYLHFSFENVGSGLTNDTLKALLYDSLMQMGMKPFNNQITQENGESKAERLIFPYAVVSYRDKQTVVDLMSGKSGMDEESTLNYSEALLEFKLDDAINRLTKTSFPVVAYAAGNSEPLNPTVRDLFDLMRNNYRFGVFDLQNGVLNADTIQALLIVKPSIPFTEKEKIKIDQYIMQGGKVVWCIDKLYAEFDSLLRSKNDFIAFDKNLNLDDILFKYGVRINSDLLQDLTCAKQPLVVGESGGRPQIERIPFPYYPLLSSTSPHPVSKNLDQVLSVFPSSIDTVKAPNITKTILLASDTNSRTLSTPALVSINSIQSDNDFRTFTKSYIPVAVLVEGNFTSLYANRFTPQMQDSVQHLTGIPFLPKAIKPAQQIMMSDADIVTNVVTQTQGALPMGMQQFENYQFANRDFFMNCIDFLVDNSGIIETRNKDFTLRLLDKNKIRDEKTLWQFINIAAPIIFIFLIGFVVQWNRKKKFAA
jgi:gliding-associated putative ABC transporter substrate-binding component GldG